MDDAGLEAGLDLDRPLTPRRVGRRRPAVGIEHPADAAHEALQRRPVEAIGAAGITRGCNPPTNTRFCPNDHVSRGEMAAFLDRALNLEATTPDWFADDNESIFEGSIDRLAAAALRRQ